MGCASSKRVASTQGSEGAAVPTHTVGGRSANRDSRLVSNEDVPDTIPLDSYPVVHKAIRGVKASRAVRA